MKKGSLCDLQHVRKRLDKSQTELAQLLGISLRALQSYEQGWRSCPPYVMKLAGLLLFLNWNKGRKLKPCYEINECPQEHREQCPGKQLGDGQLCWMITGTLCQGKSHKNWQAKFTNCAKCPVVKPWLYS